MPSCFLATIKARNLRLPGLLPSCTPFGDAPWQSTGRSTQIYVYSRSRMQNTKTSLLVAEDDATLATKLKEGLGLMGYQVSLAKSGPRALSMAETGQYPIMILDLNLPEMNGLEVCRKLRVTNPGIPVLMLTAMGDTEHKIDGFQAGADDYMVKPPDLRELDARLRALLRRTEPVQLPEDKLSIANLTLHLGKKMAYRDETQIMLTAKEFSLLEYLLLRATKWCGTRACVLPRPPVLLQG